ncbi:MAG: glycosyltransferase family 2 protein [Solirubrobacteraceae bacterium]
MPIVASETLALVTVTHNSAAELEALLTSIGRHLPGVELVVVDSASSDATLAVARAPRDGVRVQAIALDRNVGFGRGSNIGVAAVTQRVTALVNPDVELLDDSLLELAADALRPPERLLAPLVLNADGSRQDTVHPRPTSPSDLGRVLVPPGLAPRRAALSLAPWRSDRPRRVGWAVGCALVARTDTLRRLGPFDDRIFLYYEDLDLALRAGEHGVQTWFCPSARVLHHRAHSSEKEFGGEPFELLARARREVVVRRLGRRRAGLDDAAQAATFASRIVGKSLLGRSAGRERRQLEALRRVRRESC